MLLEDYEKMLGQFCRIELSFEQPSRVSPVFRSKSTRFLKISPKLKMKRKGGASLGLIISKSTEPQHPIQTLSTIKDQIHPMMFGNPFFEPYDDHDFSPYSRYGHHNWRQRQQAAEEARRRAALERYYRMKEREEQEELIRRQRQRQQEEAYRQAYAEEMYRRRREAEEERLRQQRRLRQTQPTHFEEEEEPIFQVIRGPDGRLYRIKKGNTKVQKRAPKQENKETPMEVSSTDSSARTAGPKEYTTEGQAENESPNPVTQSYLHRRVSKKEEKRKKNKKRVTIVVEDASDSDIENAFGSIWHNRPPSPGEWMEPVERFDNLNVH